MQSATRPLTCGVAMLVPEIVFVPFDSQSERMQTPGAAIVCAIATESDVLAKFEKLA